jgi:hypothetical protein
MFERGQEGQTARSKEQLLSTARSQQPKSSERPLEASLALLRRQLSEKDQIIQGLWQRIRAGEERNILLKDRIGRLAPPRPQDRARAGSLRKQKKGEEGVKRAKCLPR